MEYRQLRYFVAVADLGNIGLAASRLNVSQPPVSRQIQALEAELGVTLLERTPRGVTLTTAGRVFREEAGRILERTELARERTRQAHRGLIGRLDVAVFGTPIYSIVPRALARFRTENPATSVALMPMGKGDQIQAILSGRAHVAFGRYFASTAGLTVRNLGSEPLFVALTTTDAPGPDVPMTMAEVARRPLVLFPAGDRPGFADEVLGAFSRGGDVPKVEAFAFDASSAMAMVASGAGAALVPGAVAALRFPGVSCHPLTDCPIDAPLASLHRAEADIPVLDRFLETLDALTAKEDIRDRY